MTISPNGITFIESLEGVRLSAYLDGRGIPTIGVGHTLGVKEGDVCTQEQVDGWLREDLSVAEHEVNSCVSVPLSQSQFDALVSLTFNIGANAFKHSTLLKLLNANLYGGAANQFLAWNKINGEVSDGLTNRRIRERHLFLGDLEP